MHTAYRKQLQIIAGTPLKTTDMTKLVFIAIGIAVAAFFTIRVYLLEKGIVAKKLEQTDLSDYGTHEVLD